MHQVAYSVLVSMVGILGGAMNFIMLISQKGEKRRAYSMMEFKNEVIKYATENSKRSAATKYKVDVKRVRERCQKEGKKYR